MAPIKELAPPPTFIVLALVSFLARSKPRIPFLRLSLLRNQTETLATQARTNFEYNDLGLNEVIFNTDSIRGCTRGSHSSGRNSNT